MCTRGEIVEILILKINSDISRDYLNQVLPCLPDMVRQKYLKITNDEYFVSSILAYLMIVSYLRKKYHRFKFPIIENGRSKDINEYFSISHSNEMVCVAFDNEEIGIDIEKKRKISDSLAKRLAPCDNPLAEFTRMEAAFKLDNGYKMLETIPEKIELETLELGEYYLSVAKYK